MTPATEPSGGDGGGPEDPADDEEVTLDVPDPTAAFITPLDIAVVAEDPLWSAVTMNAIDVQIVDARVSEHMSILDAIAHFAPGHPCVVVCGPDAVVAGLDEHARRHAERPEIAWLFAVGDDEGSPSPDVEAATGTAALAADDTKGIVDAVDAALLDRRTAVRRSRRGRPVDATDAVGGDDFGIDLGEPAEVDLTATAIGAGAGTSPEEYASITGPGSHLAIVVLTSGKGGTGTTTTAINLAAALARHPHRRGQPDRPVPRVFLLDAHKTVGDAAFLMGQPKLEPTADIDAFDVDDDTVAYFIQEHAASGVHVVTPPTDGLDLQPLTPEVLLRLLVAIDRRADIVVVDAPADLVHRAQLAAFAHAVLYVTTGQLAPIKSTLIAAEVIGRPPSSGVIVNEVAPKMHEVDRSNIEHILQVRVVSELPFDDTIAKGATANPASALTGPKSGYAKRMDDLAELLLDRGLLSDHIQDG